MAAKGKGVAVSGLVGPCGDNRRPSSSFAGNGPKQTDPRGDQKSPCCDGPIKLPPHLYIPWRGKATVREGSIILPATAGTGKTEAAIAVAAGITLASDSPVVDVTVGEATLTVPKGFSFILREWAVEARDDLAYLNGHVTFKLVNGEDVTPFKPRNYGFKGSFSNPIETVEVTRESKIIKIVASNGSTTVPHVVDAYFWGYLIETNKYNEDASYLFDDSRE
jgi:hypothetical protein